MQTVGKRLEKSPMEIRYAYQELDKLPKGYSVPDGRTKPWGTSHAVLCAREAIGDAPFAVLNADDYYGKEAFRVIYDFLCKNGNPEGYAYCMVGYELGKTVTDHGSVARGVCVTDSNGYLVDVAERTRLEKYPGGIHFTEDDGKTWTDVPEDATVSMNFWGYKRSFLEEIQARFPAFLDDVLVSNPLKGEFYLPKLVAQLLAEKKATVKVLHTPDKWFGVTYAADKPLVVDALKKMTQEGEYPDGLWG